MKRSLTRAGAWNPLRWRAERRRSAASVSTVSVFSVAVAALAIVDPGFTAADVDVNDSGIWITRADGNLLGRFNYAAKVIDGALTAGSSDFDVLQRDEQVILHDLGAEALSPVDVADLELTGTARVPSALQIAMGGATVGVLDPDEGALWVVPVDEAGSFSPDATEPVTTELPARAELAVGVDGSVHVSAPGDEGSSLTIRTDDAGRPESEDSRELPDLPSDHDLAVTAVGSDSVVLDRTSGVLHLPSGKSVELRSASGASLQEPGPEADAVVIATETALVRQPLDGGDPISIDVTGGPDPTHPVVVAGCAYGAWAATGEVVRDCPGESDDDVRTLEGVSAASTLRYRVNRDTVVLNELASGLIWLADQEFQVLDSWDDILSRESDSGEEEESTPESLSEVLRDRELANRPPTALDDEYGVRPGRTTILPVLDNDTDPDGDVLTLWVPDPDTAVGTVQDIYGFTGLQVVVPVDAAGSTTFDYEVDDGRGGFDTATVELTVRAEDENSPPAPIRETAVVLEQGASIEVDVLADWRDPDGDPLVLTDARATTNDIVRHRPDGRIAFEDVGTEQGRKEVTFAVWDGRAEPVSGSLWIDVRPTSELAPIARSDHATTTAGLPVEIRPLLNDVDPNGDALRIARVPVDDVPGAIISPDASGTAFTFTAETPGAYDFTYLVTDGPHSVLGLVRVDVLPASGPDSPPVAVRDTALLPSGGEVLVDVLANDSDPAGGVLVVQSVEVDPQAGVSVAVLDHRLLKIRGIRTLDGPMVLRYRVSNGLSSAFGEVHVIPVPPPDVLRPPAAADDEATVRVGQVVTIPVLANDSHPDDALLSLVPELVEVPEASAGTMFVAEDVIRFHAGTEPGTVRAVYEVVDPAGQRDAGYVTVRIKAEGDNTAPRPVNVTARVLAGSTVRITIPMDGIDPDGDAVWLLGLDSAPTKGSVVGLGEGYLDYEASTTSVGVDTFTYLVRDSYGAQAIGTVLVGIAPPPESNQPPVARDDQVTVQPERRVAIPVLLNDTDAEGGRLALVSNGVEGAELAPEVVLDRVVVHTPTEPGTYTARYTVQDELGAQAVAAISVEVSPDAPLLAPIARDDSVTISDVVGREAIDVPVLDNDEDPDGSVADLRVGVTGGGASVQADGVVRVTLTDVGQVVPYTVTDVDGLTATAFVRVPGLSDLRPALRPGIVPLEVDEGETLEIDVTDYVVVADGKEARLTGPDRVSALHGTAALVDEWTLTFTPDAGYGGPAAISFEVTDGATVEEDGAQRAVLSLPILVHATATNLPPSFTAPDLTVVAGEDPVTVDLAGYAEDPEGDDLAFALVSEVPEGFTVEVDGSELRVAADRELLTGATGALALEVSDGVNEPVTRSTTVSVTGSNAPLATTNDDVVAEAHQGEPVTVRVLENDVSPFPGEPLTVVAASVETGSGTVSHDSSTVTVTPAGDFVGTMVVRYRVADAIPDPAREVDGRVRLTVQGRPEAPSTPTVTEIMSETVVLSWSPPVNNGSPITGYTVSSSRGTTHDCQTTTCTISGLQNDVEYTFTVVATNAVGDSDPSPASAVARPDERPDPPAAPTLAFGDGSLTVTWANQAYSDRSPITSVNLEISPAPASGAVQVTGLSGTQYVWSGLANGTAYQVRVQAVNRAPEPSDWGSYSASEIPAAPPAVPAVPTTGSPVIVGSQVQLPVSWTAPANNGDAISAYTLSVLRGGAVTNTISVPGTQTTQQVTVDPSETSYTFTVAATNKAGTSGTSPASAPRRAVLAPGTVTGLSAAPLNNAIQLAFGAAPGNGATASEIRYEYSVNGGAWTALAADKRITSGVPNNGTYTASVRAVSTVDGQSYVGSGVAANAVAPYGPPGVPTVSATGGATTVRVCWNPPARNGRDFRVETNIDNGGWQDRGTSGCLDVGNGYSQTYSISARTVDAEGQVSAAASASARTQDPPAPNAWVSKGESAVGQPGCSDPSCAFLVLNTRDFPAGRYDVACWSTADGPGVYHTQRSVDVPANGSVQTHCYFGYTQHSVRLEVINQITTPWFDW